MSVVQVYANGHLAYDSRIKSHALQSCLISESLNKGGTCTIVMLPGHPAYSYFPAFSIPVEVYRDKKLRWRGRPLPLSDALYGIRTVICEGELCWLNDAVIRPYLYQTDPKSIFISLIEVYNAAVEPWKQFQVGNVTVTDPNAYVRLESQSATKVRDAVMKLVDRCGGYILFESLEDGTRTINWYSELPYLCTQEIQLQNILDYQKQPNLTQFATRIIPYGAKGEDGARLQINVDGKDYLQDDEAVQLRGVIEESVIFDDITLEENLIARAAEWLQNAKLIPYSIMLSAQDLSKSNVAIGSFAMGQRVPVVSKPHELEGYYDLNSLDEDMCDPRIGGVVLGRETATLTGSDVSARRESEDAVEIVMKELAHQEEAIQELSVTTFTQITSAVQDSQSIIFTALEEYARTSDVEAFRETIRTEMEILAGELNINITQSNERLDEANGNLQAQIDEITTNYRFTADGQFIGRTDDEAVLQLAAGIVNVLVAGYATATFDRTGLTAPQVTIRTIHMGNFDISLEGDDILTIA